MLDRAALLHDLALAFGANAGLRGLLVGLAEALGRHLAVVELELAQRRGSDRALLRVVAPGVGRQWTGERSSRVLEPMRAEIGRLVACEDEVGRVGLEPIVARLRLAIGEHLLGIAFSRRALDQLEQADASAMLIAVLDAHTRRSTWLLRTAAVSRRAYRRLRTPAPKHATIEPATIEPAATITSAVDFAGAQREAIAHALTLARGKIYGPGGAAELLGLKPSTLQSKMRKLGLDRGDFVDG
ncbi:hypothetical protein ACNOYE_33115 [Nannocystaceae bacterium ST9]